MHKQQAAYQKQYIKKQSCRKKDSIQSKQNSKGFPRKVSKPQALVTITSNNIWQLKNQFLARDRHFQ